MFYDNAILLVGLTTLGSNLILIGGLIKSSVQTFQTLIEIYRWGNIVYHHLKSILVYRPQSYPFRSLSFGLFPNVHLFLYYSI